MSDAGPVRPLHAGTVGRAHGLDGSFRVSAPSEPVVALIEVGGEVLVGGRSHRVDRVAGHAARPLLRLRGHDRREDAESLAGAEILVPREAAAELEDDEWWAEDLEGLSVHDGGREVGVVTALLALPSCEVLEVSRAGESGRPPLLVPLVGDAVREVDLDTATIDIDLAFLGEE